MKKSVKARNDALESVTQLEQSFLRLSIARLEHLLELIPNNEQNKENRKLLEETLEEFRNKLTP